MIPYIFFLDIDDTILYKKNKDDQGTVSQRVLNTIQKAREMGHKVFINTGRAPSYFTPPVKALKVDGFVCGCGAYGLKNGKILFQYDFPNNAAIRLLKKFSYPGAPGIVVEGVDRIFRYRNSYWKPEKDWILGTTLEEFEEYLSRDKIVKISICQDIDPAVIPELEKDFFVIHHPTEHYTECCIKGCSKATGIERVMESYGLPLSRSVAIGDSENDLEMIQAAGIGIAMGQAKTEIKALADRVTLTILQDGAATAIEEIIAEAGTQIQ